MYTGIIEATGTVRNVDRRDDGLRVAIDAPFDRELGDSLAVDGVCLTVGAREDGALVADCSAGTCRRTTLGQRAVGDAVNVKYDVLAKYARGEAVEA